MQTTATPPSDPGFKLPGAASAAASKNASVAPANPAAPANGLSSAPPGASAPAASSVLPAPDAAIPATVGAPIEVAPLAGAPVTDTSTRDLAIGGAVFLVLLIVYFFIRNAYTHHLVVRRVAPSSAGSAGWMLFLGLGFVSAAAVLAMINPGKFLTFAITGPLVVVGVIALAGALFVGRR